MSHFKGSVDDAVPVSTGQDTITETSVQAWTRSTHRDGRREVSERTPMVDGFRYPFTTRHPHCHHTRQQTAMTDRDEGSLRETSIFVAPLCGKYPGYGSKGIVCRADAGVRKRTGNVNRAHTGRTQHMALSWAFSLSGLFFLADFVTVDLAVSSRISSFPQILGLSESRRQSPGWHSLDGNLLTWAVRGCPLVVESGSSGTAWFRRPAGGALLPGLRG